MRIRVISFTNQGEQLASRIRECLPEEPVTLHRKPEQGVAAWAGEQFRDHCALIFVGACGIAVRAVAPWVKDKLSDSPVLVVDEEGRYVIPLLSGHVGGANELARLLASRLGAVPVVTTATDIRGKFAVDVFAQKNGLRIVDREGIVQVSSKVLRGETIIVAAELPEGTDRRPSEDQGLSASQPSEDQRLPASRPSEDQRLSAAQPPEGIRLVWLRPGQLLDEKADVLISERADMPEQADRAVLRLKPRDYVLGIGCRKGKTEAEISALAEAGLARLGISWDDVAAVASIDRKQDEPGLCSLTRARRIPFVTFSEEQLQAVEGVFHGSPFVAQTVGVDNVCERAALAACGHGGVLVLEKQAENGVTLAVAKRPRQIRWEW